MSDAMARPDDWPVVMNIRTTEQVRRAVAKMAREQERSMNWTLDRIVRLAVGLGDAKEAA